MRLNIRDIVREITYLKSEIDSRLSSKIGLSDVVSSSRNGVMSSVDKVKLDGIEDEANKTVVVDVVSSSESNAVSSGAVANALSSITYPLASSTVDGLMSKEDKQKLDSLSSVMLSMELEDNTTLNYESED